MKRIALLILAIAAGAWAADELSVSVGWTYNKNGRKRVLAPTSVNYDISGNYVVENVQNLTSNHAGAALFIGGVTNAGFAWFKNLDASNSIVIGTSMAGTNVNPVITLRAGEATMCWLGATGIWARAVANWTNYSTARLDYMISDR